MTTIKDLKSQGYVETSPGLFVKAGLQTAEQINTQQTGRLELPSAVVSLPADFRLVPTTDESALNKSELAFYHILQARHYPWLRAQAITLKLGDDCRYTPDFEAIGPNGEMLFWEYKGFMRDDAQVKLKVAARQFPWARFYLVRKQNAAFTETQVKP